MAVQAITLNLTAKEQTEEQALLALYRETLLGRVQAVVLRQYP